MHVRRGFTMLAGIALVGALSTPAASAAGVTAQLAPFARIADSASVDGPVVVHGTLRDIGGRAVSRGTVVVLGWPADEHAIPMGGTVSLTPIGRATTTSDGGYSVRLDPTVSLAKVAGRNGVVNAELEGYSGTTLTATYGLSLIAGSGASATTRRVSVGLSANPEVTLGGSPTHTTRLTSGSTAGVNVPDVVVPPSGGCIATKTGGLGVHYGVVGQTYSQTNGVRHTFVYTSGASTSIGVGISSNATGGTFTSEGSKSVSSTVTEYYPTYGDYTYRYYKTGWSFASWKVKCSDVHASHVEVRADSFAGGAVTAPASAPSAHKCVIQVSGTRYVQSKTRAITWTNGVSLSYGGIGFSLSTQTGYSSTAELSYAFANSRWLCGSAGTPGQTPLILSAKATNS